MSRINIFGLGQASKSPYVTSKALVNMYCEPRPRGEKSAMVAYRTPGLSVFTEVAGSVVGRGALSFEKTDLAFEVVGNVLYQIDGSGTATNLGLLSTSTGRVSMADNGTQIMIVDGTYGYIYTTAPAVTISTITRVTTTATLTTASPHGLGTGMQVTIAGALPAQYNGTYTITVTGPTTFTYVMVSDPGGSAAPVGSYTITSAFTRIVFPDPVIIPLTVCFLSGRFIINILQSSRYYWSGVYDGLSWDALDFANAETSADPIVAVWANNGQLILFGTRSTEYWGDSGTLDQPFVQIQGTATEWGLAATWSVSKYDNSVAMLVRNRMGQVMVAQLNGYLPKKISNLDVDDAINKYAVTNDASSLSYMLNGHPMYVINFPNAQKSWLYDGASQIWTQLESFGSTRWRGEFGISFLTYTLVASAVDGKLYSVSDDIYDDDGDQIESYIISQTITDQDLDRVSVDKLRVDMEVGQGTSGVAYPQVGLSISRDNGNTYGAEMMRNIGPIGTYGNVVDWTRLGTSRSWVFKLRVTDPVHFTLVNAMLNPED